MRSMIKSSITVVGAMLLLVGCSGTDVKSQFSSFIVDTPEEKLIKRLTQPHYKPSSLAIGVDRDVNHNRADGLGLIPSPQLTAYLNRVRDSLIGVSGVTNVPGSVYLRASNQFSAYTTPDGNVYLDIGLLRSLDNEDEVAAVLAHELAHSLLGHYESDNMVKFQKHLIVGGQMLLAARNRIEQNRGQDVPGLSESEQKGLERAALIMRATEKVVAPAWTRGQETQADLLAVDLLVGAGYNATAMIDLLEKTAQWQAAYSEEYDFEQVGESLAAAQTREEMVENLKTQAGFIVGQLVEHLSRRHPDPEKRLEKAQLYMFSLYRDTAYPAFQVTPWREVVEAPAVSDLLKRYDYAFSAQRALEQGDLAKAARYARLGVSGASSRHSYPRWVFAMVRRAQGRNDKALLNLELAMQGPEPAASIYRKASLWLRQSGQEQKALGVLEQGFYRLDEPVQLMPDLISFYHAADRTNDASKLVLECAANYPDWARVCASAREGTGIQATK